jgi:hypothetical protein
MKYIRAVGFQVSILTLNVQNLNQECQPYTATFSTVNISFFLGLLNPFIDTLRS